MKFTQIQHTMISGPGDKSPIILLSALGEDGSVYQYQRTSTTSFWEKLTNRVVDPEDQLNNRMGNA
jgi:hypothetical protein